MIEAVVDHRAPKYLIFQILWLSLGLFGALIMTANMARDVIEARVRSVASSAACNARLCLTICCLRRQRFNSTNHPSVKLTNAVLIALLRAMLGNWIYIVSRF
jgi:hypothetical protein